MANAQKPEVSDEQATNAMRLIMTQPEPEDDGVITATVPETEDAPPEPPEQPEEETEPAEEEGPEIGAEGAVDDLAALKASLKKRDAELAEMTQQNENIRQRAAQSLQWAKNLALTKSTETDKLKRYLQDLGNKEEIDRAEIQRVLGGDPQPQPTYQPQPQPQQVDEIAAMDEQLFLLDNPMNQGEYEKFVQFIQTENVPGAIVPGNTYATLNRFKRAFDSRSSAENGKRVKVAKSIQRVQKQAQRAAGSISGRASPSAPPEKPKDPSSMTFKEMENTPGLLDELFRRSVEG